MTIEESKASGKRCLHSTDCVGYITALRSSLLHQSVHPSKPSSNIVGYHAFPTPQNLSEPSIRSSRRLQTVCAENHRITSRARGRYRAGGPSLLLGSEHSRGHHDSNAHISPLALLYRHVHHDSPKRQESAALSTSWLSSFSSSAPRLPHHLLSASSSQQLAPRPSPG
ncbi:hypothetical protein BAUCODRAFT_118476 [Baudoinia panamericana UAMH 10762]|uniref:Uncharacterized protein n=1 Tax=Baudoinia panamericana (strain UAMH 10762) TaxID=717646 RepID=M2MUW4_BAUPA|nr:uncharacterized protein BAUCODRAFT_118476 [Baudoinia panamericana UAMH 10762]EMD00737.1 hypothetical protein BAUCODRAFT_118476 [Baudoinia panamericana UAMH 10762]